MDKYPDMEYYSVIKRTYQATKRHEGDLDVVRERSQSEKTPHYRIPNMTFWKRQNFYKNNKKYSGCQGSEGWGYRNSDEQVKQRGFLGQYDSMIQQ